MADLSKVKVSGVTYSIKDAIARNDLETLLGTHALEALGAAAWLDDLDSLVDLPAADEDKLPNAKAVVDYVDSIIETIPEFDVVIDTPGSDGKPATPASKDTFHKIYLCPATSPATPNVYMEYITVRSGTKPNYTYSWEKIGDTSMDLSTYVQKTTTIAGVDLQNNITKQELQTALDLAEFAYADTGEVDIPSQTVSGLKATGKFTPALTGELAETSTAATLTKTSLTPSGTNSTSTVTFAGNVDTNVLTGVETAAVLPTFTEGAFTAATITKNNVTVATEGVTAAMGTGDDSETLILTAASTDTATNVTAFTGGSKAADTFTAGSAATFTTDTAIKTLGTGTAAAQTFTGTAIADAIITAVNYDKTTIGTLAVDEVDAELDVDDVVIPAQDNVSVTPVAKV